MKLVMTLLVRDEADIVDAQIAYHLDAGVDLVVATDNRSEDATTEILRRYAREGVLHLIREPGDDLRQSEWVTRMARLAATDHGADWILNADADEFWLARRASLKELLAVVPARISVALPALAVLLAFQHGLLVQGRRTRPITVSTAIEVGTIAALFLLFGWGIRMTGVTAAMIALVGGRLAGNLYLRRDVKRAVGNR